MKLFFEQLQEWNLDITWTFIKIGTEFIDYNYRIKTEDVRAYATTQLETNLSDKNCLSVLVADTDREVLDIVGQLAEKEIINDKISFEKEKRKWIVYALHQAIHYFPDNPSFSDLLALNDLWYYFDFPTHYPWNPRDNEYIKVRDVQGMLEIHKIWIRNELLNLKMQ